MAGPAALRVPQSTIGVWLRPADGVTISEDARWADGISAGPLVVPSGSTWEMVSASHRGLPHLRHFRRLLDLDMAALTAAVVDFASLYGMLAPVEQQRAAILGDGRTVRAEAVTDWSAAAASVGRLLDVIESVRELELSPGHPDRRRALETHLQGSVSWCQIDGQLAVDVPADERILLSTPETSKHVAGGMLSDATLIGIARHAVARAVTRGMTGRLRPDLVGCDARHLLSQRRSPRRITYVTDSLLGTLYHQLAFALVGTTGVLNVCVVCGREFGATRRDAKYCGDPCRSRHNYPSTARYKGRGRR